MAATRPPQAWSPAWAWRVIIDPGIPTLDRADLNPTTKDAKLAKPNYQYEKRQKDLARKKKQEEKRQRKLNKANPQPQENPAQPPGEGNTTPE